MIPPLPNSLAECRVEGHGSLTPWSGASGPFWIEPAAVVRPRHPDQVAQLLKWAAETGTPLIARGAGPGMPGGNVGPWVILDLTALEGEILVDAEAMTVTAPASATGHQLREAAHHHGLDLPALPSSARWCTLGGMVACNAAGARSLRHGSASDWLTGADWLSAEGTPQSAGRQPRPGTPDVTDPRWSALHSGLAARFPGGLPWPAVAKNSSGYALDRWLPSGSPLDLLAGSEGTLGILTAATLRLTRPDPVTRVMVMGLPDLSALVEGSALAARIGATACEYFGRTLVAMGGLGESPGLAHLDADGGMLLVEVGGSAEAVASMSTQLCGWAAENGGIAEADSPQEAEALWALRHQASPRIMKAAGAGRRSIQFIEDCVVPLPALGTYVERLEQILLNAQLPAVIFGHAAQGNLHVNPLVDPDGEGWRDLVANVMEQTVNLVAELGGTLAGEHGDGRLRAPWLHRFHPPEVISAFREIKRTLDPAGILNPGVILPHPGTDPFAGLGAAPDFRSGSQGPEAGHR